MKYLNRDNPFILLSIIAVGVRSMSQKMADSDAHIFSWRSSLHGLYWYPFYMLLFFRPRFIA